MSTQLPSPVSASATVSKTPQPDESPELASLYDGFAQARLVPLWTEIGDLMPTSPRPAMVPHMWQWDLLYGLASRAGDLVPVGRGGERRAIALANPGLGGRPFATPTLWAAIQYLRPGEIAPEHRHSQNAFRFVVEGEGVWTVVDGDPVAMSRGDFLLTPSWRWHGHSNAAAAPMSWLDGLDIPFVHSTDSAFFEFGPDAPRDTSTPSISRGERLWSHPGLVPLSQPASGASSPLLAYRWRHTDEALAQQLDLEDEGHPGVVEPGHAAVRYSHPGTGCDVMPTMRAEFHRLRGDAHTAARQEVGSAVWQVFEGSGVVTVGDTTWNVTHGDLFVVPSWANLEITADGKGLDLFRFCDTPIFERLGLSRVMVNGVLQ